MRSHFFVTETDFFTGVFFGPAFSVIVKSFFMREIKCGNSSLKNGITNGSQSGRFRLAEKMNQDVPGKTPF